MRRPTTAFVFVALTVLFGTSFPAIEVGLTVLPPLTFAAARYGVSAVCLFAFVLLRGRRVRPPRNDWPAVLDEPIVPTALGGFCLIVVGFALLKERELAAEIARYRFGGR